MGCWLFCQASGTQLTSPPPLYSLEDTPHWQQEGRGLLMPSLCFALPRTYLGENAVKCKERIRKFLPSALVAAPVKFMSSGSCMPSWRSHNIPELFTNTCINTQRDTINYNGFCVSLQMSFGKHLMIFGSQIRPLERKLTGGKHNYCQCKAECYR